MNYETIGKQIGALVDEKNRIYGDAFNKTGEFLKILYPNGIEVEDYASVLALVRVFDKMMRIANGNQGNENAWNDLAGYGILMSGVDARVEAEKKRIYEEMEQRLKSEPIIAEYRPEVSK
ncbi:MAG TPA: hypothetical protein GX717_04595 [Clostridiaceae bacterium]|nr:hypothetical protein [Clostridiaceae bacterium]